MSVPVIGSQWPHNEQLHQLLTALEQLAGQSRIHELDLAQPIALLAAAFTEQRLQLVRCQAGLRESLRISRFLAGALLAMDARHQANQPEPSLLAPPMLPVATARELRKWIAAGICDEHDRDPDHSLGDVVS